MGRVRDDAHLKAALKFLERNQAGTMSAADALVGWCRPEEEVPLVGVDADGWLGDLLSGQADRRLRPMTTPAGFSGELRPNQERGLSWLSFLGELGRGNPLADDMGLGKTIQLLSLVSAQPRERPRCSWSARCRFRRMTPPVFRKRTSSPVTCCAKSSRRKSLPAGNRDAKRRRVEKPSPMLENPGLGARNPVFRFAELGERLAIEPCRSQASEDRRAAATAPATFNQPWGAAPTRGCPSGLAAAETEDFKSLVIL